MRPFLLLSTRSDDALAAQEHASVAQHMQVDPSRVVQVRLEQTALPALDLDRWAGFLIGGSPFTSSDPQHTKSPLQVRVESDIDRLLAELVARDLPTLGLCYGVGTIGRHVGAVVDATHGEQLGAPTVTLTEAGLQDPLCAALPRSFTAFVGHKEAVRTPTADMVVLAGSEACPVQMFRVGQHVRATQFHPELDPEALVARIRVYTHHGYFDPAQQKPLIEQVRATDVNASHAVLATFAEIYG